MVEFASFYWHLLVATPQILKETVDLVDGAIGMAVFLIFLLGASRAGVDAAEAFVRDWRRGLRWAVGSLLVLGMMKVNHEQFAAVRIAGDAAIADARAAQSLAEKEAKELEEALLENRPLVQVTVAKLPSGAFLEWKRTGNKASFRLQIRVHNVTPHVAYDVRTDPATFQGVYRQDARFSPVDLGPGESDLFAYAQDFRCEANAQCEIDESAATHHWVDVFYKAERGGKELRSAVHFDIYKDRYVIVDRKLP